jgi:hypothetical protein
MSALAIRPLTAGEEPLFNSLADSALVGYPITDRRIDLVR